MTEFLGVMTKYVATFLMGVSMAAATVLGDTASITALFAAGSLWFFSNAMPVQRQ